MTTALAAGAVIATVGGVESGGVHAASTRANVATTGQMDLRESLPGNLKPITFLTPDPASATATRRPRDAEAPPRPNASQHRFRES